MLMYIASYDRERERQEKGEEEKMERKKTNMPTTMWETRKIHGILTQDPTSFIFIHYQPVFIKG